MHTICYVCLYCGLVHTSATAADQCEHPADGRPRLPMAWLNDEPAAAQLEQQSNG